MDTADTYTKYYKVDITTDSIFGDYSVTTNSDGSVTYTYAITGTNTTATVTYSGSVEYFTYTTDSGEVSALYATGEVTVTAYTKYSYNLSKVNDTDASPTADSYTYSATVKNISSSGTLTLGWNSNNVGYINVYSDIAFTFSDGENDTSLSKGNSILTTNDVAKLKDSTLSNGTVTAGVTNYYFLGWAKVSGDSLTFTDITVTSDFDSESTYYAIWGYSSVTLTPVTAVTSGNLPTPSLDGTFFSWYTDSKLGTVASGLTADTYTYYAKAAASTVTINGVTYTFSTSTTGYTYYYSKSPTTLEIDSVKANGGYYAITSYSYTTTADNNNYDVKNDVLVIESEINGFDVVAIQGEVFSMDNTGLSDTPATIIFPDSLIFVWARAFYKNTAVSKIVFLANKVYFSNDTGGTASETKTTDPRTRYAFYMDNSNGNYTNLTVYYKNVVGIGESSSNTYHYVFYSYYNKPTIGSTKDYFVSYTTTWTLYNDISVTYGEGVDKALTYETSDIQSIVAKALATYSYVETVDGYYFFTTSLPTSDVESSIKAAVLAAINNHTASTETDRFVGGYDVNVAISDYGITVEITESAKPYYAITTAVSGDSVSSNTGTVSYSSCYSDSENTYSNYLAGSVTATFTPVGSYKLTAVSYGDNSSYTITDKENGTYSVTIEFGSCPTIYLTWEKITESYVIIYSDVAASYNGTPLECVGSNTYYIGEAAAYAGANATKGDTSATLTALTANESGYYFLGYATDNGTIAYTSVNISSALTDNNSTGTTYYAIWGKSAIAELTVSAVNESTATMPTPSASTSGTFYSWYTGYKTHTYSGTANFVDNKTYQGDTSYSNLTWETEFSNYSYSVFSGMTSELVSGTYTYYARMQYSFTITFTGSTSTELWMDTSNTHFSGNTSFTYIYGGTSSSNTLNYTYGSNGIAENDNDILEGNFVFVYYENVRHPSGTDACSCANIIVYENFEYFLNEVNKAGYDNSIVTYNDSTHIYSSDYVTYHSFNLWASGSTRYLTATSFSGMDVAVTASSIGSTVSEATALTDYTSYTVIQSDIAINYNF
ncbi:MAG: hypothetical protein LUI60_05430 [Clostridia bacterium]|nr:hypothetical protein [Clostridia bacterium]